MHGGPGRHSLSSVLYASRTHGKDQRYKDLSLTLLPGSKVSVHTLKATSLSCLVLYVRFKVLYCNNVHSKMSCFDYYD